jgi:hypothetical protein
MFVLRGSPASRLAMRPENKALAHFVPLNQQNLN